MKEIIVLGMILMIVYLIGIIVYFERSKYLKKSWCIVTAASVFLGAAVMLWEWKVVQADLMVILSYECIAMLCVPAAYVDCMDKIIPNKILIILLVQILIITVFRLMFCREEVFAATAMSMTGMLACGGILIAGRLLSQNGVGGGDIKLFLAVGYLMGFDIGINILLFTLLTSAFAGIILVLVRKKSSRDLLPMGPFVLTGLIIAVLLGA